MPGGENTIWTIITGIPALATEAVGVSAVIDPIDQMAVIETDLLTSMTGTEFFATIEVEASASTETDFIAEKGCD